MIHLAGYIAPQFLCETVHSRLYRATRKHDQLPVVIKVAREASAEVHAAAQQEINILRKLDGLVVVRAIELGYFEDRPALVMAWFAGDSMDQWLGGRPIALGDFLRVATSVLEAVAGIHERGVLHRDLKPSNILVNPETLEVCIVDFGVAASLDGAMSIQAAAMVGSLAYLSPEQTGRTNHRVDCRSDLYSLGVTFYEMVTGTLPFDLASPLELVHAHLALTPRPPSELDPGIPAVVSDVIGALLAKDPDDRYRSAQGVAADLRAIAGQRHAGQPLGGFPLGQDDRARTFLLPTRLYGRDAELARLETCLASAQDSKVELLVVGGPSGSGKTALFAEAERRMVIERGQFGKGKFDRLARNLPFSAISQAITGVVEQLLAGTSREIETLRTEIVHKLGGLGEVILEIAPAVERVIGPQPAVPTLGLLESQARIADVFWRLLRALATRERPLVIVLDDLQWADSGSLALLEALLAEGRQRRHPVALLLLGAYREEEVAADHPFRQLLDRATGAGAAVHQLTLGPLTAGHVAELLGDTLRMPVASVAALADSVFRKTSGNAFFVHQFLKHAHQVGLFRFAGDDGWQWDLEAIQAAGIPADAVGLVAEKMRSLTPSAQRIVVDASVIGDDFDLPTLFAVTEATERDALHAVHALIEDGLIVRTGGGYRFAHDKIREAALGMCSDDRASRLHVEVGRHRVRAAGPGATAAQVFAITDHLNHAHSHLTRAERIEVAALNLRCGKQALAVGAVAAAAPYLIAGLALLDGGDPWQTQFSLMFGLTLERAQVQLFQGDAEAALSALQALLARDLPLTHAGAVYLRLIAARISRSEYHEASRVGMLALAAFGISIPRRVRLAHLAVALIRGASRIGRDPESLLALPASTDEVPRVRNQLINALSFPLRYVDPNASALVILKAAPMMVDDGLDSGSPIVLLNVALLTHIGRNNPVLARRFANVASAIHDRLGSPQHTANLLFYRHAMLEPWHVPYRESLEPLRMAIEKALDIGDRHHVEVCHAWRLSCALIEGTHLTTVEQIGQDAYDTCIRLNTQRLVHAIVSLRDVTNQLRVPLATPSSGDWRDSPQLARLEPGSIAFHAVTAAQILVLLAHGEYDAAYVLADRICPAIFQALAGFVIIWIACVGLGVGAAIRMRDARGKQRRRYRRQLADSIKRLRGWAVHNPALFAHKALWLEAERERARGRNDQAIVRYLEAHEQALSAEYPHIAAVIDLRRGELALEIGLPREASSWFEAAIQAFRAWGAGGAVASLEQRHAAHVPAPRVPRDARRASAGTGDARLTTGFHSPEHLDLGALLGAAQAIAQEVTLASVLDRVMSNTMASAGATSGVLLLEQRGALVVEIRQRAAGRLERCAIAVEDDDDLPRSIVRYVHHSGETVVLEDAARVGRFVADPWVRSRAARSILCAPIVKQARRVGVLLLHNDLVTSAFSDRHLTTLQMLSTQAAISIDNAILYDQLSTLNRELEARVEERTLALREAQHELLESARKAGMADVAVEVLHNVGNALNSVNVSAQLIQGQIADSKLKMLTRVLVLLDDHKHDLAVFFTDDPRGKKLAPMMSTIASALTGEQDAMQNELARLRTELANIGAVVRELEVTAEDKGIAILEAPRVVLGEAIARTRERSDREHITISTDLRELPDARVDKPKGLDILVGLLTNALEAVVLAAVEDKQIRVSVRTQPDTVVFRITDNGIGIPSDNLARIFHGTFSTKLDRRGANLHRFANFATSAGGRLTAESDGIGRGATFTLVLPNRGAASERSPASGRALDPAEC